MKNLILNILKKVLKILARLTLIRYKPGIVGITGNVGKTSAKEAINLVLSKDRKVRASSKNFNNELGLPISIIGDFHKTDGFFLWIKALFFGVFQIVFKNKNYPEVLVLEYGVDRPNDMKYLLEIAEPHIGIFTAMGETPVHIEFFSGPEGIVKEKSKLISQLPSTGFAIINIDDPLVAETRDLTRANVITFGFKDKADVKICNFVYSIYDNTAGICFKLAYGGNVLPARIDGCIGKSAAYASSIAAAVGLVFGMNLLKITDALSEYKAPNGRQKIIPGVKKSIIIDDTYNASPLAMEEALSTLNGIKNKRKIAVLGDMLELGKHTLDAHEKIGAISSHVVDLLFTVGMRGKIIAESAIKNGLSRKKVFSFTNIHEAGMQLQQKIQKDDVILVKGSQGVRMEKIVKEIMAEPINARDVLVRQNKAWLRKEGMYD